MHEDGGPLYIEVKSTRGRDGRFSWPRAEFQLAMRQRHRYVLYRVYEADIAAPLIIDFPTRSQGSKKDGLSAGLWQHWPPTSAPPE